MKKIAIIVFVTSSIFCPLSQAQQPVTMNDFAFGQPIEVSELKSVVQILLPESLYLTSKNLGLMDIAVFNSSGEAVPHSLLDLEQKQTEKIKPAQPLPVFPIYGNISASSALNHIKISANANNTVIEISPKSNPSSKKEKLEGYLVDASKINNGIDHFQFFFRETQKNKVLNLRVDGSNDLLQWSTVVTNGVTAWFEMNGQKIVQDTIANDRANFKFYRISFPDADLIPLLKEIKVHFLSEFERQDIQTFFKKIEGKKVESKTELLSYVYDLGGSFPVLSLSVKFKDNNSLARFSIQASHEVNGPWIPVSTNQFFTVTKNGNAFESLTAEFSKQKFQYWKLQLLSDLSGIGQSFPDISFSWQPHRLLFLARGEAPFLLAYGSSKTVSTAQTDFTHLEKDDFAKGTLKPQITLGGEARINTAKSSPIEYRKYILWAILLSGALVIGSMAFRIKKNTSSN